MVDFKTPKDVCEYYLKHNKMPEGFEACLSFDEQSGRIDIDLDVIEDVLEKASPSDI